MRATNHHLLRAYVIKTPPFLVVFCFGIVFKKMKKAHQGAYYRSVNTPQ